MIPIHPSAPRRHQPTRSRLQRNVAQVCALATTLCLIANACGGTNEQTAGPLAVQPTTTAATADGSADPTAPTTDSPASTAAASTTIDSTVAPSTVAPSTVVSSTVVSSTVTSTTPPETSASTTTAEPATSQSSTSQPSTTAATGAAASTSSTAASDPSSSTTSETTTSETTTAAKPTTTNAPTAEASTAETTTSVEAAVGTSADDETELTATTAAATAASLPTPAGVARAASPRCVAELSVSQLAAHTIAALFTQGRVNAANDLVAAEQVGSLVLLGDPTNAATLAADFLRIEASAPGADPLFMVDEEGGRVQRLRRILGQLPSAEAQADLSAADRTALWRAHAQSMAELGFDIGLAPVVDIGAGVGIGTRSFGPTSADVTLAAASVIEGMVGSGITPTLKHFPGHGGTDTDSHIDLPTTAPIEQLDLDSYRALLSDAVTVMVGHLSVPGLTEAGVPTSLTPATYDLLRNDLGFDGLIMTDALNMGAVVKTSNQPAVGALIAGADIVMVDISEAAASHARIVDAVESGILPISRLEAAAERVLRLKSNCG